MSINMFRRAAVSAVAVAAALGLAACNGDGPDVTTPTGGATSATSAPATTEQAPPSDETTTDDPSVETSDPAQDPTGDESSSSDEATGTTETSDANSSLSIGEPAVIESDDDTFRLTPTALEVAPDSVYSENPSLKKSNGTVYYLRFKVTAIDPNSTYFGSNSINGLFFHPEVGASVKNAKRLYGDTSSCTSEDKELSAGQSATSCYVYQIPGDKVSTVVYNDSSHNIRWTAPAVK